MNTPNDELGVPRIVQLENTLDELLDWLESQAHGYDDDQADELYALLDKAAAILAREGEEDDLASYE